MRKLLLAFSFAVLDNNSRRWQGKKHSQIKKQVNRAISIIYLSKHLRTESCVQFLHLYAFLIFTSSVDERLQEDDA